MRKFFLLISLILSSHILSSCCNPHSYQPHEDPCPPEPFEVPEKIRIALVLGSGGVKGMAHVGVLEELERAGISVDLVVGCSAGSLVGALYCDHPCSKHLKETVEKMRTSNILDINLWSCRYGLSQGKFMDRYLEQNLGTKNFCDLKIPLVIVATDILSGELVPIGAGDLKSAVMASCSVPFVFSPVTYRDRVLVDGGVINPVPVCVAKDLGAHIIIAVDLSELLPKTFPCNLFGVVKRSAEIAVLWQSYMCIQSATVVIKPKMCNVGLFDDRMRNELYQAGREACLEALPKIQEILEREPPDPSCDSFCKKKILTQLPCYQL